MSRNIKVRGSSRCDLRVIGAVAMVTEGEEELLHPVKKEVKY